MAVNNSWNSQDSLLKKILDIESQKKRLRRLKYQKLTFSQPKLRLVKLPSLDNIGLQLSAIVSQPKELFRKAVVLQEKEFQASAFNIGMYFTLKLRSKQNTTYSLQLPKLLAEKMVQRFCNGQVQSITEFINFNQKKKLCVSVPQNLFQVPLREPESMLSEQLCPKSQLSFSYPSKCSEQQLIQYKIKASTTPSFTHLGDKFNKRNRQIFI